MEEKCPDCNNRANRGECEHCDRKEEKMGEDKKLQEEKLEIEKKEAPKPVEVKIPEKLHKSMQELSARRSQLMNQMLNISIQKVELETKQREIVDKVKSNNESYKAKLEDAFRKLKLNKKKNYRWSYNGKDCFIGMLIPEPKKAEGK